MKKTDLSLFDQMQISDLEIENRMDLLSISAADLSVLKELKPFIDQNVDSIVEEFYNRQTTIDEISLLIGDAETLSRLKIAQRQYILDLFAGNYGRDYVNNRLRIGMVHKRIGVEPKLYLSAIKTMKDIVGNYIKTTSQDNDLLAALNVLDKLLYFDVTLVFDTYIRSLVSEIEIAKNRTELYAKSLEEKVVERTRQLEELSRKDGLTGIFNQRAFREFLNRDLALSQRNKKPVSLLYLDIDKFKTINDSLGHQKGDEILIALAKIMADHCCRNSDIPARYGGDEFCMILPDCDTEGAQKIAEKIISNFSKIFSSYSLSIGISQSGVKENISDDELIKRADKMMYESKKKEGSWISVYK